MSVDRRFGTKINAQFDYEQTPGVRFDTGTYVGIVKSNVDGMRHGRLVVYIPQLGGNETDPLSWKTVNYASPFFGEVNPNFDPDLLYGWEPENKYGSTTQSYGMWFVPPDVGNSVLVVFAVGNPDYGYWFACVPQPKTHYMVPGIAASDTAINKESSTALPVTEFNKYDFALIGKSEFLTNPKPVHTPQAKIIKEQGLDQDTLRGVLTSSSQRESPSRVFGISTPGRPDPDPAYDANHIHRNEAFLDEIRNGNQPIIDKSQNPKSRRGGHSFVMDDGDLLGNNQVVRLRSGAGHEIIMNDSAGVIYVINSTGTGWVELTADGSLNVFSSGSISMRAKEDINLHADNDVRIHAGNNIVMKADNSVVASSEGASMTSSKEGFVLDAKKDLIITSDHDTVIYGANGANLFSKNNVKVSGGQVDITPGGSSKPATAAKPNITEFPETEKNNSVWRTGGTPTKSAVSILPTHEPWERPSGQVNLEDVLISTAGSTTHPGIVDDSIKPGNTNLGKDAILGTRGINPNKGNAVSAADIKNQLDPAAIPDSKLDKVLDPVQKKALFAQIGQRESSNIYDKAGGDTCKKGPAAGQSNFLGKYQMGAAALVDQGYITRDAYDKHGNCAVHFTDSWTGKNGITSKEQFLNSPRIQESVMSQFTENNYKTLVKAGAINPNSDSPGAIGGMLMTAHLLGPAGAIITRYPEQAINYPKARTHDAFGSAGKEYYYLGQRAVEVTAPALASL